MLSVDTRAVFLQHIMQRHSNDCVVATAAMVAGVTYDTAAARSIVPVGERALSASETVSVLEAVTGVSWIGPKFAWWQPIRYILGKDCPVVVAIRRPWRFRTFQHCVPVHDGYVNDPEFVRPVLMNKYERRHWTVVEIYRPAVVGQLMEVLRYHRRQRSGMRACLS